MKTLYLSYDGLTDPLGQSQVLPYIIELSKNGIKFTVISFEKNIQYELRKYAIQKLVDEHAIIWIPLSYTKKPPILSTIKDLLSLRKNAIKCCEEDSFSIVHCRSYITALVGLQLKKRFPIKLIFDMRGFWADERIEGEIWNIKNPLFRIIYNFFKIKESQLIQESDYIISLTENGEKEIESWELINCPIKVIPCCADLQHFSIDSIDSRLVEKFKMEKNIQEGDFVISYLGSIGTWYMLEEMLDFFKVMLNNIKNAKFLFITNETPETIFDMAINKNIAINKIIVSYVNREELPSILSISKVSIFFIKPLYSKKASSPTKMGELMGMGIPLICNSDVGDVDKIIQDTECGVLVKNFTNDEYSKAINQIDTLLEKSKTEIIEGGEKYYSLNKGVEKYFEVYKTLDV